MKQHILTGWVTALMCLLAITGAMITQWTMFSSCPPDNMEEVEVIMLYGVRFYSAAFILMLITFILIYKIQERRNK